MAPVRLPSPSRHSSASGEALRGPVAARNLTGRVAPNHAGLASEYAQGAAAAGPRTDIDLALVSDIVLGAMLMRLLSTGTAPDAAAVQLLVDILLRGLAATPTGD